jgi:hypothetical protein
LGDNNKEDEMAGNMTRTAEKKNDEEIRSKEITRKIKA